MIFEIRYWRFMFWLNIVLAIAHACKGNNAVFLALGMAVVCKGMLFLLENSTEN